MEASSSLSASLRRRAPRMCYRPSLAKPVGRKCKSFQWVDEEICPRGKVLIPEQRQTILRLEAEVSTCKKREKCLIVSLILALVMCGICLCVI
ncbi:hypothetical protein SO802_003564 [Lithocarpus litseifolius]|uniref:Zinc finger GRF-type domain-containing protein n=1 Tax=Lithocarpus litseifolius TaxID=425828 RepID=A0AAW2E4G7_9ROSI